MKIEFFDCGVGFGGAFPYSDQFSKQAARIEKPNEPISYLIHLAVNLQGNFKFLITLKR